jgi:hypothetical protein
MSRECPMPAYRLAKLGASAFWGARRNTGILPVFLTAFPAVCFLVS